MTRRLVGSLAALLVVACAPSANIPIEAITTAPTSATTPPLATTPPVATSTPVASSVPAQPPADPTAIPGQGTCARDADCTISTFTGCCACCARAPYAVSVKDLSARNQPCKVVECNFDKCSKTFCKPTDDPSNWSAACIAGTCQATRKPGAK